MALNDESEEFIKAKHKEICLNLNMDSVTGDIAWNMYLDIKNNYTLDGVQTHWLCCSLYVACKDSMVPTVGDSASYITGNCVSLTRLLRSCNIRLVDFFQKMKKWSEMASVTPAFRNRLERLERSFAVSLVIYQKFVPIFKDVFNCSSADESRSGKGKKAKPIPCTSNKVFEFCWILFICAKGEHPDQCVDLVTSFHMLLCCVDLMFSNAVNDERTDLININFPVNTNSSQKCIMKELCRRHEGTALDALETKQYSWQNVIKKFFEKEVLHGNKDDFTGLLSKGNFESNFKSLNTIYETYVLSCGEFDERIVLDHYQFGSNCLGASTSKSEKQLQMDESINTLVPGTPLTRRDKLPEKTFLTPLAAATQSVKNLRSIVSSYNGIPPASLIDLIKTKCNNGETTKIENILKTMSDKFSCKFQTCAEDRFRMAEALYYRLLENIIKAEFKIRPNLDLKSLMNVEIFHKTIIVCCVEIVISAYNSQKKFPWVLECFELDAFTFYKIIEMVVLNHQDLLSRDVIKHLNSVEEQCLESLAWTSSSPLWKKLNTPIPTWREVDLPKAGDLSGIVPHNRDFRRNDSSTSGFMSPVTVASDRYHQSPCPTGELAKKQLFRMINNDDYPAVHDIRLNDINQSPDNNLGKRKPNRAGSLGIFYRKFYKLAYVRIKELCKELKLSDDEILKKIWTVFENSIIEQTILMKDRHLDQILMCAIYVVERVTKSPTTFTDIMKFYRNQPQAASHVYRSVLLGYKNNSDSKSESNSDGNRAPVPVGPAAPSDLAGCSTSHGSEERGDIIKFYNSIYVQKMQTFAMKFSVQSQDDVTLSPLPSARCNLLSPKKISANHSLYVHPLEHKELPQSPDSITYSFHRSPAKDLKRINQIVNNNSDPADIKRNMKFEEEQYEPPVKKQTENQSFITRKLYGLIADRQDKKKD